MQITLSHTQERKINLLERLHATKPVEEFLGITEHNNVYYAWYTYKKANLTGLTCGLVREEKCPECHTILRYNSLVPDAPGRCNHCHKINN